MTRFKRTAKPFYIAVVAISLLVAGVLTVHAQTTPQSSDQNQLSSSAAKKNSKKKPADSSKSASAPATPSSASSPNASATNPESPTAHPTPPATAQQASPPKNAEVVWVNTDSGVYHKPGTRYYGKTKKGKYMTEADAIKSGYRPARRE